MKDLTFVIWVTIDKTADPDHWEKYIHESIYNYMGDMDDYEDKYGDSDPFEIHPRDISLTVYSVDDTEDGMKEMLIYAIITVVEPFDDPEIWRKHILEGINEYMGEASEEGGDDLVDFNPDKTAVMLHSIDGKEVWQDESR